MVDHERLMTSKEVIAKLNISRTRLSNLVRRRAISHFKIGGRYYFNQAHLDSFLKARERRAG